MPIPFMAIAAGVSAGSALLSGYNTWKENEKQNEMLEDKQALLKQQREYTKERRDDSLEDLGESYEKAQDQRTIRSAASGISGSSGTILALKNKMRGDYQKQQERIKKASAMDLAQMDFNIGQLEGQEISGMDMFFSSAGSALTTGANTFSTIHGTGAAITGNSNWMSMEDD